MKRLTLAVVSALSAVASVVAQTMTEALAPFVESGELPGAISILEKPGTNEIAVVGWADVAGKIPMAMDTPFMQCSQTKGFCGVTVAILVEEGRISLDDAIDKYLPCFSNMVVRVKNEDGSSSLTNAKNKITIRQCMNHTAGFEFEIPTKRQKGWPALSLQDTALEAAAQPLKFEPGEGVQYSNTGIDVAAAVTEVVTGKPWDVFLKERVLDPLGMKDTTFQPTDEMLSRRAYIYRAAANAPARREKRKEMPAPHNGPTVHPSAGAGLWTTAADQLKFYRMLMNLGLGDNGTRILKEETARNLLATSTRDSAKFKEGYSLGLNIRDEGWFGHGGAWNSDAAVNPDTRQLRIWVMQVVGRPRPWDKPRDKIQDEFFGKAADKDGDAYTGRLE